MKISLNWIQDYIQTTLSPEEIGEGLTNLGLECTFEATPLNFTDVVLGKVLECNPHPNSDHLSVCQVDIGDGEIYGIVCGAPNVRQGIHVPVARPGATLGHGDFKIKKTKLRGVVSQGMICSGKELEFSADHEGILILDTDQPLGTPIEKILDFGNDVIYDLDLTPNKGDCFSHLGAAREIAILEKSQIKKRQITVNETDVPADSLVQVTIDDPEACPRYAARVVRGVKVGPSPQWLADRLNAIGQNSINNVVDAANYVLMDSGHPLHTFDLNQLKHRHIKVRFAKAGEKITLLDEVERELSDKHLLICDGETPVALAGVMGGLTSAVHEDTIDILIESAYFNPGVVRKGSKLFDLSTEASKRFERDTDIENVICAINQLAQLIVEVAGGEISKGIVDCYPLPKSKRQLPFSVKRCNHLLGTDISPQKMIDYFEALEIEVTGEGDLLTCTIPYHRNDLEREVDLSEEIARLFGYNNLPLTDLYFGNYGSFIPDAHALDGVIRQILATLGFNEHVANSLVSHEASGQFHAEGGLEISNPLSQEMQYLRTSLIPGLLSATSFNEKRQQKHFKLFEIGAVHLPDISVETGCREEFRLGMLWYGSRTTHWRSVDSTDFYRVKGELEALLRGLSITDYRFIQDEVRGYQRAVSIVLNKERIGVFGWLDPAILQSSDIAGQLFVFEGDWQAIRNLQPTKSPIYQSPIPFPAVNRDISLLVDTRIPFEELVKTIRAAGGKLLRNIQLFDLYEGEQVGANQRSLAFTLTFQADKKTLKDKTVDGLISNIIANLKKQHQAVQR